MFIRFELLKIIEALSRIAMKETPILLTPRLTLRPFRIEDAEDMYEWTGSWEVTRFLWWYPNRDLETTKAILKKWIRSQRNYSWAIVRENEVIGEIQVIKDLPEKGFEFGITSKVSAWGKGYMREASFKAIDYLFASSQYEYGYAESDARNERSHHLLEALGFIKIEEKKDVFIAKKNERINIYCFRLEKENFSSRCEKFDFLKES